MLILRRCGVDGGGDGDGFICGVVMGRGWNGK
jgi:hypothetical protein